MTPIEVLIAARSNNLVGPHLTPKPEWLVRWTGPVEVYIGPDTGWIPAALLDGSPVFVLHAGLPRRLDCRRPEVRDLLVRHGCPAWARDVPPAVWCWGMGVEIVDVLMPYHESENHERDGVQWIRRRAFDPKNQGGGIWVGEYPDCLGGFGWQNSCVPSTDPRTIWTQGPETGALGRACADIAALRDRCLLEEADGWYVPGNEIGWWPREVSP